MCTQNQKIEMDMKTAYLFNSRLDTREENHQAGRSQVSRQKHKK